MDPVDHVLSDGAAQRCERLSLLHLRAVTLRRLQLLWSNFTRRFNNFDDNSWRGRRLQTLCCLQRSVQVFVSWHPTLRKGTKLAHLVPVVAPRDDHFCGDHLRRFQHFGGKS